MEERKKCAFSFEHRVLLLLLLLLLLMMMMMMTMMSVAMVTRWLSWQRGVRWCSCEVDKIPARRPHTHRHTPDTGRHTITTTPTVDNDSQRAHNDAQNHGDKSYRVQLDHFLLYHIFISPGKQPIHRTQKNAKHT